MSMQRLVLVLNASYEPIHIVTARRALMLVLKGAAAAEDLTAFVAHSARIDIAIPSVVRLLSYRRVPHRTRAVSRRHVLLRDQYTCQYCGQRFVPKALTLDHVIPRSRGGASSWENLVACCFPCNNHKADRTPSEAGMQLARKPVSISNHVRHRLMAGPDDRTWTRYLFC
jgi:5-methylcytosine-specific restriction endonuclease McrA